MLFSMAKIKPNYPRIFSTCSIILDYFNICLKTQFDNHRGIYLSKKNERIKINFTHQTCLLCHENISATK